VFPWGLLEVTDPAEFRRAYRHRLLRKTPKVLSELQDLRKGYCAPLVLLCFEDLSRPDAWCHRSLLAEWISQHTGETIRER
jgi:uncharacterized protein YeaO (DUF488 family)